MSRPLLPPTKPARRARKVDDYRPGELAELDRWMERLTLYASPGRSSWTTGDRIRASGDHQPAGATADPSTRHARGLYEHFLARIRNLTRDIEHALTKDPSDPAVKIAANWHRRSNWCIACKKGNRRGARYCDRCGRPLDE